MPRPPSIEDLAADFYALLGVTRAASEEELRAAYRRLARRHHPDVAGAASTETFQKIASAYDVLSDPDRRAAYDGHLVDANRGSWVSTSGPTRDGPEVRAAAPSDLLPRVSGTLDTLVARGAARRAHDGAIEILLTTAEAHTGGTLALDLRVQVACPTCGGLAHRHELWCARCEHAGVVPEDVTVHLGVPPLAPDGLGFSVPIDAAGLTPPLRVRLRTI